MLKSFVMVLSEKKTKFDLEIHKYAKNTLLDN